MINCAIITIGTELTSGYVGDLNSTYISKALLDVEVICNMFIAVPDDPGLIRKALDVVSEQDLIIITGGLGPTEDDITREVIADHFDAPLVTDPIADESIRARSAASGRALNEFVLRQAQKPAGAELIRPERGTAPGIIMRMGGRLLLALPGVPREVEEMMPTVRAKIDEAFPSNKAAVITRMFLLGPTEVDVEEKLRAFLPAPAGARYNILSTPKGLEINLFADKPEGLQFLNDVQAAVKKAFPAEIYSADGVPMEGVVGSMLVNRKKSIATAESCTGGLLAERITSVSGASDYFKGSIVSYANDVKETILSVPPDVIDEKGAVSRETAIYMARNVRMTLAADIGVAVTGIAGPSGGTADKPVGLVFIAVATSGETACERFEFRGDRERVRLQASQYALDMVRRLLEKGE